MKILILCLLIGSIAANDQLCSDCPGCLSPQGKCWKYNLEMAKEDSKGNSMTRKQFSEKCIKKGGIDCSETNLGCKLSEECSVSKPYCRQSVCYECIADRDCSRQKPYCSANKCVECEMASDCAGGDFCYVSYDNACYWENGDIPGYTFIESGFTCSGDIIQRFDTQGSTIDGYDTLQEALASCTGSCGCITVETVWQKEQKEHRTVFVTYVGNTTRDYPLNKKTWYKS